jgi:hypothetical protein
MGAATAVGAATDAVAAPALARLARSAVGGIPVEYFPANRTWGDARSSFPLRGPLVARLRQSKLTNKYAGLPEVLLELAHEHEGVVVEAARSKGVVFMTQHADPLEPYRAAAAQVSDDLRLEGARLDGGQPTLSFTRRDGTRLTLDELADGGRQAMLFALWSTWLGLRGGVVLVDRPELHLHRRLVAAFVDRLVGLWPGCQVFVATDAPELVHRGCLVELTS